MNRKKKILSAVIPVLCAVLVLSGLAIYGRVAPQKEATSAPPSASAAPEVSSTDPAEQDATVSLIAVGDNLIHNTLIDSGRQSDGSYNYDALYADFKQYIEPADIAVINQETILGGSAFDYSGYPLFNSPWEIGEAAINAGFDVFTCATNHSLDMGTEGIEQEIAFFDEHPEVVHVGTNASQQAYDTVTYYEKNGIVFALLNYTYGTNGIPLPDDKPWVVNMMDKDKIRKDVEAAKEKADVIIAFPHWGTENSMSVSDYQREYAQFFCSLGVDIVIGTHPHVLEPVEWVTDEESGNRTLVYYSIGNFISHQTNRNQLLGGMAEITIARKNGEISITSAQLCPTVCHYYRENGAYHFAVYKLSEYTDELAGAHVVDDLSVAYFTELVGSTISDEFLDIS